MLLSVATAVVHLLKPATRPFLPTNRVQFDNPWITLGHLWIQGPVAFSWLEASTLLPLLLMAVFAWRERRRSVPYFTWPVTLLLLLAVFCLPSFGSNWGLLTARFLPFFWVALLLRAPATLPRWTQVALPVAALAYGGGLWADYVRLEGERRQFCAAVPAVPEHAALLPLIFDSRAQRQLHEPSGTPGATTSSTGRRPRRSFAVERSYPLTYKTWPPPELIPPAIDEIAGRLESPARACEDQGLDPTDASRCLAVWRERWAKFWQVASPAFDHVLTWGARSDFPSVLPPDYAPVFIRGRLVLYARQPR